MIRRWIFRVNELAGCTKYSVAQIAIEAIFVAVYLENCFLIILPPSFCHLLLPDSLGMSALWVGRMIGAE